MCVEREKESINQGKSPGTMHIYLTHHRVPFSLREQRFLLQSFFRLVRLDHYAIAGASGD